MRLEADWLTAPATRQVTEAIQSAGFEVYFVGGCVRNALLGVPVNDLDLSTNATPEAVIEIAKKAGLRAEPTGISHGTVTIVSEGTAFEITTFRRDVSTDGRRATVTFSQDIREDAERRDFTMNALYVRPNGEVVDPLGGLNDLRARRLRFILDAEQRIKEDYLRSLRYFRFHAWYGDTDAGLDPDALAASAGNLEGLSQLSIERVTHEMTKLLAATNPAPALAAMQASGVLHAVMPGAAAAPLAVLVHFEELAEFDPDPIRRLAVIWGDIEGAPLRLSKADQTRLDRMRAAIGDMRSAEVLGYSLGAELAKNVLLLRAALFETPPDSDALDQAEAASHHVFPVRAADLMPAFEGPSLGAKLKGLEKHWVESGFLLTKADLLK
jgi:poly(A) polymerase